MGVVAVVYVRTLYAAEDGFEKLPLPEWSKPALVGALLRFRDEDLAREAFMAARVRDALSEFDGPLLVVTGGFHSSALAAALLQAEENVRGIAGQYAGINAANSGAFGSAVAATLIQRAVGDRLTCVFCDTGMMRLGEPQQVVETFGGMGMRLVAVDASEEFLSALEGVTDPEQKRKVIGRLFIEVFEANALKLEEQDKAIQWLGQGTIGTVTGNRFTKAVIQFNQSGLCISHSLGWKQGKTTERW